MSGGSVDVIPLNVYIFYVLCQKYQKKLLANSIISNYKDIDPFNTYKKYSWKKTPISFN